VTVVAGGGGIVTLQAVRFLQVAAVDNILMVELPPVQRAVILRGWQAWVEVDRQRAFPILDRFFHIVWIKSDGEEDDPE